MPSRRQIRQRYRCQQGSETKDVQDEKRSEWKAAQQHEQITGPIRHGRDHSKMRQTFDGDVEKLVDARGADGKTGAFSRVCLRGLLNEVANSGTDLLQIE